MTISSKHLRANERVVIDRHPHWWFLTPRAAALVASMVLGVVVLAYRGDLGTGLWPTVLKGAAALLLVATLVAFVARLIEWRTTNFVITSERCIYRSGVFHKTGIEIPIDRISAVFFSQTFFERMLKAGDLGIESAGEGSRQNFTDIYDPVRVQNTIYEQMEDNENRRYDRIGSEVRAGSQPLHGAGATPDTTRVMSVAEQIEKLADLHERGVITAEEFAAQKAQLLS